MKSWPRIPGAGLGGCEKGACGLSVKAHHFSLYLLLITLFPSIIDLLQNNYLHGEPASSALHHLHAYRAIQRTTSPLYKVTVVERLSLKQNNSLHCPAFPNFLIARTFRLILCYKACASLLHILLFLCFLDGRHCRRRSTAVPALSALLRLHTYPAACPAARAGQRQSDARQQPASQLPHVAAGRLAVGLGHALNLVLLLDGVAAAGRPSGGTAWFGGQHA